MAHCRGDRCWETKRANGSCECGCAGCVEPVTADRAIVPSYQEVRRRTARQSEQASTALWIAIVLAIGALVTGVVMRVAATSTRMVERPEPDKPIVHRDEEPPPDPKPSRKRDQPKRSLISDEDLSISDWPTLKDRLIGADLLTDAVQRPDAGTFALALWMGKHGVPPLHAGDSDLPIGELLKEPAAYRGEHYTTHGTVVQITVNRDIGTTIAIVVTGNADAAYLVAPGTLPGITMDSAVHLLSIFVGSITYAGTQSNEVTAALVVGTLIKE